MTVAAQPCFTNANLHRICTRTCNRTAVVGIVYTCRYSSLSVYPLGSTTTDTACYAINAANAADAPDAGPFKRVKIAPPIPLHTPTILPQSRPVSRSAPYSPHHPETSNAHKCQSSRCTLLSGRRPVFIRVSSPLCVNRNARIWLLSPWPHPLPFRRLH